MTLFSILQFGFCHSIKLKALKNFLHFALHTEFFLYLWDNEKKKKREEKLVKFISCFNNCWIVRKTIFYASNKCSTISIDLKLFVNNRKISQRIFYDIYLS